MKWTVRKTLFLLLLVGLLIACSKVVYLFFNVFNILDLIIFLTAGYFSGKKVAQGHWSWGFVLAFPCLVFDAILVYKNGYSNIVSGIGTGYLASIFLCPLAACVGIVIGARNTSQAT